MNKRIRELAELVGFDLYNEEKEQMIQEFAELLIRGYVDVAPAKDVIDKAVAAEREACARVCDGDGVRQSTGDECAAAIRARGERD